MNRGPLTRRARSHRKPLHRLSTLRARALVSVLAALVLTGCGGTVTGQATSPLTDPLRAGGLPVVDGPSGPRDDAPEPTGTVEGTDGGEIDRLAQLSVNDLEEFWEKHYGPPLKDSFSPVDEVHSYDSTVPFGPQICGLDTYDFVNAFYCNSQRLIAWDRGTLMPTGQKYFGDMAVTGVLAHEYGHVVQRMAGLAGRGDLTMVAEQQADCFGGAYLRWVAEGSSPRFTLSTSDGLNLVLAAMITSRDPIPTPGDSELIEEGHGSAFERISAMQNGICQLVEPVQTPSGNSVSITGGDLDEAVAGLLTNGMAASDVNGDSVKAGFARIDAFRAGVLGDDQRCYQRYP